MILREQTTQLKAVSEVYVRKQHNQGGLRPMLIPRLRVKCRIRDQHANVEQEECGRGLRW